MAKIQDYININDLERKVIVDYAFMKEILSLQKIEKENDKLVIINSFLTYLNQIKTYDIQKNIFDLRMLKELPEQLINNLIEKQRKNLSVIDLNDIINHFTLIFSLLITSTYINDILLISSLSEFYKKWKLLSQCQIISIKQGEIFSNIQNFWKEKLKNFIDIPYAWVIIQEPFLFSDIKPRNINALIKLINSQEYVLITRKASKEKTSINGTVLMYKEKQGIKVIHDRFILTNYFIIRSGNSFGFYDPNSKQTKINTSLIVTSIVNDFDSLKNFLTELNYLNFEQDN